MAIRWKKDGWTLVQEADAKKHILEIACRTENGMVVEVRTRHNDGEEKKGTVLRDGKNPLPLSCEDFEELFEDDELIIR